MKNSVQISLYIISISLLCVTFSECQTTTGIDEFAEVLVQDHVPVIPEGSRKTYTTSLRVTLGAGVTFRSNTFQLGANKFYRNTFRGSYFAVDDVTFRELPEREVQVTFNIIYVFPILNATVSGNDDEITTTIGNIGAVSAGLNAQSEFISFFPVINDASFFTFTGDRMCSQATCNGTYVACTENTAGVEVTCVSECKNGYCYNKGICSHASANVKPVCRCPTYRDLWVFGERCETKIALWLVILLAVLGFLFLLLVLIIVIVLVRRKQREKRRKQQLLNTAPKPHINPAFRNDEIRTPTETVQTIGSARPIARDSIPRNLTYEDSFSTVTSTEAPPSEYRTRSRDRRRRNQERTSRASPRDHRSRSRSNDRRRRSPSESSSDPSEPAKDVQYLSTGSELTENDRDEISVNDLDMQSETPLRVGVGGKKPSPIKWLPRKTKEPRPGWKPSLGPSMFDIPSERNNEGTARTGERQAEIPLAIGTTV